MNTFIVPTDTIAIFKTGTNPRNLVKEYYSSFNFIVDTGDHIFFYQQPIDMSPCGTIGEWDTLRIPPFIDLKTNDLVETPIDNIEEFVKLNLVTPKKTYTKVSIASIKDTIESLGLLKIMSILKDTSNHVTWVFRKSTPEEEIVLDYKKRQIEYRPDEIKWDTTKTLFFSTIDKIMRTRLDRLSKIMEK